MAARSVFPQRLVLPVLALAVILGVSVLSVWAPAAESASAPAAEFSAERAMDHVEVLAAEPRPMGSPANDAAERYLVETLELFGWGVVAQVGSAADVYGDSGRVEITNVIGRYPGTSSTGSILLIAHYDTFPETPGANDNAAPVAALLETARALQEGPRLTNDIVLLFTDAEEPEGRAGATAFLEDRSLSDDVALVVNFEAAGGSGPALLAELSEPQDWLIAELVATGTGPAAFSALTATVELMGDIGTDFDPFRNAGYPGFHFAYLRGSPIYHTAADDVEAVGAGSLQHLGSLALGISTHFGDLDLSAVPLSGDSVAFFKVGPQVVHYPAALSLLGTVIAAVAWATVLVTRRRNGQPMMAVMAAAARLGGLLIAATVVGTLMWMGIGSARSSPGVVESYSYLVAIVSVLTVSVGYVWRRGWRNPANPPAVIGLWLGFAALAAAIPGVAYLFAWPALFAAAVLLAEATSLRVPATARLALVATPALVLAVPLIDSLFLFAQPRPGNPDSVMLFAVAAPLLLALLVVMMVASFWPGRRTADQPAPLPAQSVLNASLVSSNSR